MTFLPFSRLFRISVKTSAALACVVSVLSAGMANANRATTCQDTRAQQNAIEGRVTAFIAEYPVSSLCAISMTGGALTMFAEEVEEELVIAAAACTFYCVFGEEAACGYASTMLLGFAIELDNLKERKNRICGNS